MDWNPFYSTMAAATATVMGLLFIAVQLSMGKLSRDDNHRYRAMTLSTFNILFLVFFLPACFLVPNLDLASHAKIIFVGTGFGLLGIFRNWMPVFRGMYFGGRERTWQTLWHFIGPLLAFTYLIFLGVQILLRRTGDPDIGIAFALIAMFGNGIRNSWNLVVEMAFDRGPSP